MKSWLTSWDSNPGLSVDGNYRLAYTEIMYQTNHATETSRFICLRNIFNCTRIFQTTQSEEKPAITFSDIMTSDYLAF